MRLHVTTVKIDPAMDKADQDEAGRIANQMTYHLEHQPEVIKATVRDDFLTFFIEGPHTRPAQTASEVEAEARRLRQTLDELLDFTGRPWRISVVFNKHCFQTPRQ